MTTPLTPAPSAPRVAGLRQAVLLTLAGAALGALVAAPTGGSDAVLGVLAGAALLVGFFVVGVVSTQVVATVAPALSLLVALMTYTFQVVVLGMVFLVLQSSGLLDGTVDRRWLGVTVVIGTLGWTAALVRGATRERIPHYHTPSDLAKSREEPSSGSRDDHSTPG